MGKQDSKEEQQRGSMLVGVVWSCADVKLLLTSLLFLCTLATIIPFIPSLSGMISPSDLRSCLSSKLAGGNATTLNTIQQQQEPTHQIALPLNVSSPPLSPLPQPPPPLPPSLPPLKTEQVLVTGVIRREFNPVGSAAYLFIQMGAYRGGADSFAVIGLGSKPLHVFAKPKFACEWIPDANSTANVTGRAYKILPDWGYGRVYTVVVVNCTFPAPVNADNAGGRLVLHMTTGGGGDRDLDTEENIVALVEKPAAVDFAVYKSPPKYDYLYCGSSLYGSLSPQRVREWIAYHAKLFGKKSHFVIHDAGGVHPEVMEVLRPWMEKGVVTLQDIRSQERFDGYYHNQFLVVNDCLHRYRFAAKWMFFFDVDEFIYVEPRTNINSLLDSISGYTQFTIEQMTMSGKICAASDAKQVSKMWGMEKLVYRDVKKGVRRDRKYAVQPRNVFASGVHMSQNVAGRTLHKTEKRIMYYHYHGTIAQRREPCLEFANTTEVKVGGTPYVRDHTLRRLAGAVKQFELKTIGSQLRRTRQ